MLFRSGWPRKKVLRLWLTEGAALATVGAVLGVVGGFGYAAALVRGLGSLWRDAVGTSSLSFHALPQTAAIGFFLSIIVSVGALWSGARRQASTAARVLLAGSSGDIATRAKGSKHRTTRIAAAAFGLMALGLLGAGLAQRENANPAIFFCSGMTSLIAGLCTAALMIAQIGRAHV